MNYDFFGDDFCGSFFYCGFYFVGYQFGIVVVQCLVYVVFFEVKNFKVGRLGIIFGIFECLINSDVNVFEYGGQD